MSGLFAARQFGACAIEFRIAQAQPDLRLAVPQIARAFSNPQQNVERSFYEPAD